MNLAEIGTNPLDEVHGMRPLGMTCQLGFCPLRRNRRRICFWLIGHTGRRSEFDCMDVAGVGQMRGSYHRSCRGDVAFWMQPGGIGRGLGRAFPKWSWTVLLGETGSNCIDVRLAGDQASCCGVNLAFRRFWGLLGLFSARSCQILPDPGGSAGRGMNAGSGPYRRHRVPGGARRRR